MRNGETQDGGGWLPPSWIWLLHLSQSLIFVSNLASITRHYP